MPYPDAMLSRADDDSNSDPQAFWTAFVSPRIALTECISPCDKTGAVHARRVLNDELSAMHLAMCSLRTRCNALAPISALPAEVLVHIFHLYAEMRPPASHRARPLGWIEVTHVCRFWRDTALHCPSLWSDISFMLGSKWTKEMLARTKSVPISVHRDLTWATQRSLRLISAHLPRTRELSLVGPSLDVKTFIDTFPSLHETLEDMVLGPVDCDIPEIMGDSFELHGALSGCRLPSLERLVLRTFWVPWSAPILHGLKCLEVHLHKPSYPKTETFSSSPEELFSALKSMPDLVTLSLSECLPSGPWKDGSDDVLQLPQLKWLQLHGPSVACFGIANRLSIPASCRVQLWCRDRPDDMDIAKIFPFLATHVGSDSPDLPPWHTLLINAYYTNFSHLQMWRQSGILKKGDPFHPKMEADFSIYFYSPGWERSIRPLKALFQTLPLESIRTVSAYTLMKSTSQEWIDIFGRCTNVEEVSFSGKHATPFCKALSMTMDGKAFVAPETCEREHLFLGKLKVLELDFHAGSESAEPNDVPDIGELQEWLFDRMQVKDVRELVIQECLAKEELVERSSQMSVVSCCRERSDQSDREFEDYLD